MKVYLKLSCYPYIAVILRGSLRNENEKEKSKETIKCSYTRREYPFSGKHAILADANVRTLSYTMVANLPEYF